MKLDQKAFALSAGIVWGLVIFLLTNIRLLQGGEGTLLSNIGHFYKGYSYSFVGSIVGLVWGFVSMFIVAWVSSWLYNKFVGQPKSPS